MAWQLGVKGDQGKYKLRTRNYYEAGYHHRVADEVVKNWWRC